MLNFLRSILKFGEAKMHSQESIVREAVERAVDGTYPLLRAVLGYKRKILQSIFSHDHGQGITL
jgi:hypothetical protein